jgi:hypothetical protein
VRGTLRASRRRHRTALAPTPERGGYRFTIVGHPGITVDIAFQGRDPLTDAMVTTSNRAVNVLAAVHAAPAGIIESFSDLPFVPGQMA